MKYCEVYSNDIDGDDLSELLHELCNSEGNKTNPVKKSLYKIFILLAAGHADKELL